MGFDNENNNRLSEILKKEYFSTDGLTPEHMEDKKIKLNTISEFEKTYPELAKEFLIVQEEQYRLFASKMLDYGLGNIALGSDLSNEEDKNFSITGIWLRCNDKINRLKNLIKRKGKNYVEGEGLVDSFIDISNYGIIAQLVLRNKWK
tara:strand:- start:5263 stop:5706 length:444 start_codon:yes stop_codon:yes gene_type:complete